MTPSHDSASGGPEGSLAAVLAAGPVKLRGDNYTPLSRTPWAGDMIARCIKAQSGHSSAGQRIGEAWDFSAGPEFPTRLDGDYPDGALTLGDIVTRAPQAALGHAYAKAGCEILVKLINARQPLSFQVHPADGHPALQSGDCGKPESWLVLAAEPGAGIYAGFSRGMSKTEVRRILESGTFDAGDMQFLPVAEGDWFEIAPGVPHAVGPGVLLVEPQRVLRGRAGKTWRLWDWDRRYVGQEESPLGQPRELHVEAALGIIDPERQWGVDFARAQRRLAQFRHTELPGGGTCDVWEYGTARDPLNPWYKTARVKLSGGVRCQVVIADGYGALLMTRGQLASPGVSPVLLTAGDPALLPAACKRFEFVAAGVGAEFVLTTPASAPLDIRS